MDLNFDLIEKNEYQLTYNDNKIYFTLECIPRYELARYLYINLTDELMVFHEKLKRKVFIKNMIFCDNVKIINGEKVFQLQKNESSFSIGKSVKIEVYVKGAWSTKQLYGIEYIIKSQTEYFSDDEDIFEIINKIKN